MWSEAVTYLPNIAEDFMCTRLFTWRLQSRQALIILYVTVNRGPTEPHTDANALKSSLNNDNSSRVKQYHRNMRQTPVYSFWPLWRVSPLRQSKPIMAQHLSGGGTSRRVCAIHLRWSLLELWSFNKLFSAFGISARLSWTFMLGLGERWACWVRTWQAHHTCMPRKSWGLEQHCVGFWYTVIKKVLMNQAGARLKRMWTSGNLCNENIF